MPDTALAEPMADLLEEGDDEPPRRLSVLRLSVALLLAALAAAAGYFGLRDRFAAEVSVPATWSAPYVDVTANPLYQFQDPSYDPSGQVVLGFVVAGPSSSCAPSWGARYTLAQASTTLALDARVAQLRAQGVTPVVSFGGKANTDLAVACQTTSQLAAAYRSVIDQYRTSTVDLDVEGAALDDFASIERRAAAVALIQRQTRASGGELAVWLTLPVEPSGLQANALSVVSAMLRAHVDLAGVNVMAMDLNLDQVGTQGMEQAVESSVASTEQQLASLFPRFGVRLSGKQLWNKIGVTVMIGQNDLPQERFTVADARRLVAFSAVNHLGRVSMWSLNRDRQCGSGFSQIGVQSDVCSGVSQAGLGFSKTLSRLKGTAASQAGRVTAVPATVPDNPATSPYPVWQPAASYQAGYKVVRQGYIYQAKWYSQGQDPAAQVQYSWQSPWVLVGPVLPGDHAPKMPTLPEGTYPDWSVSQDYTAGQRVLFDGLPYQARWNTQGASPAGQAVDPQDSPWLALFTIPGEPAPS